VIGSVLDKYEVLQKLGEGGMATVYRGRHLTLGREVAIKVLHPHLSATERNRKRFAREARAIEHMDHENILKIFDYSGSEADDCYIVTEFVDGLTLQEFISERGRLPSEVSTLIGVKLAEALSYAHGMNIIHRDLKPENVMLRRDGTIKLMDFGIAHFLDEMHLTLTGALVGSPAYMSPEQAMERPLDQRSDLFSLGTLLFHLVTGQLPFTGSNPSIILRNIIDGNRPHVAELVPDISDSFADTIERLLQSDPGDRQVRASDALEDLRQVLADVGIEHTDKQWSLQRWMLDPDTYEAQLQEYLRVELLQLGQARLSEHNHLEALRLFNRLLSMDEDNEEVLTLIQEMHNLLPEVKESEGRRSWWLFAITMPMAAGLLTWALWPEPPVIAPAVPAAVVDVNPPEIVPSAGVETTAEVEPDGQVEAIAEVETTPQVEPIKEVITKPVIATPTPRIEPSRTPIIVLTQPPADALPGQLTVLVPGAWGDIFIDDVLRGRTGQGTIKVKPGTHTLRVENDYSLPHIEEFTIDSDSVKTLTIPGLKRKPATVDIRGRDGSCEVYLDGTSLGTAAGLGYRFQLSEPDRTHTVELRCGDGNIETHEIDGIEGGSMVPLGQR
jgi:serine/threonine-protein kinase